MLKRYIDEFLLRVDVDMNLYDNLVLESIFFIQYILIIYFNFRNVVASKFRVSNVVTDLNFGSIKIDWKKVRTIGRLLCLQLNQLVNNPLLENNIIVCVLHCMGRAWLLC